MTNEEFETELRIIMEKGTYLSELQNKGLPIPIEAINTSAALRISELVLQYFGVTQKVEFKNIGE